MSNVSMLDAFASMTGASVEVTYVSLAFVTVGLVGYLMMVTLKDGWNRYQDDELKQGDLINLLFRAVFLFMFMLAVFTPAS